MIRKVKGEYICECNECGEEFPGGTEDDFRAFVDAVKAAGWIVRKDGDEWLHVCSECLDAWRE